MAARCTKFANVWNPVTGRYSRKCVSRRKSSGFGGLGTLGQATGLRGTLGSVKGLLITGGIAAGGAIITTRIYDKLGKSLNLSGWQRALAKMATGIALGILIGKVLKKPRIAAAFAIGPVVAGGLEIFGLVMKEPGMAGVVGFEPVSPYRSAYAPLGSTPSFERMPSGGYPRSAQRSRSFIAAGY